MAVSRECLDDLDGVLEHMIEKVGSLVQPEHEQMLEIADAHRGQMQQAFLRACQLARQVLSIPLLVRYVQAEFAERRKNKLKKRVIWASVQKVADDITRLLKAAKQSKWTLQDYVDNATTHPDWVEAALKNGDLDQKIVVNWWKKEYKEWGQGTPLTKYPAFNSLPQEHQDAILTMLPGASKQPAQQAEQQGQWITEVPKSDSNTINAYHGTTAAGDFDKFNGKLGYFLQDPAEAKGYAENAIISGSHGAGEGKVMGVHLPAGKIKNIDDSVMDALMNDGDVDEVIEAEAAEAKKEGYKYLNFMHPSTVDGNDINVYVAIGPQDVKILDKNVQIGGAAKEPTPPLLGQAIGGAPAPEQWTTEKYWNTPSGQVKAALKSGELDPQIVVDAWVDKFKDKSAATLKEKLKGSVTVPGVLQDKIIAAHAKIKISPLSTSKSYEDWAKALPGMDASEVNQALKAGTLPPECVINYWLNKMQGMKATEKLTAVYNSGLPPDIMQSILFGSTVSKPVEAAMTQSAATAAKNLGKVGVSMSFDAKDPYAQAWISKHTANMVVQVGDDTKNKIKQIIDTAFDQGGHPYETAAQIRDFIPLTAMQSQSVFNQQVKWMKSGKYTPQQQLDMTQALITKKKIYRSLNIARTETVAAATAGQQMAWTTAVKKGLLDTDEFEKAWIVTKDDRLCDVCAEMENERAPINGQFQTRGGIDGPPLHPQCRCAVSLKTVKLQQQVPGMAAVPGAQAFQQQTPTMDQPEEAIPMGSTEPVAVAPLEAPSAAAVAVPTMEELQTGIGDVLDKQVIAAEPPQFTPEQQKIEDVLNGPASSFDYKGPAHMGGAGKKYLFTGSDVKDYLFKPSWTKGTSKSEKFRGYAQEAASKLGQLIDPDSAVPIRTIELPVNGQPAFGTLQPVYKVVQDGITDSNLATAMTQQGLQREHVTDWLIGNFDAHKNNFIYAKDANGDMQLMGVDKEQAFRYLGDPKSAVMGYDYHPNAAYGENESVYNTMFRQFAQGKLDLDLQAPLPFIQRAEAISDDDYRAIWRPYAESLKGKGPDAEKMLDQIVARKNKLRETYRSFYQDLLQERTGTGSVQKFKFMDEPGFGQQETQATTALDEKALSQMKTPGLMQMAKNKGIKYYKSFSKDELVDALSHPEHVGSLELKVKQRIADAKGLAGAPRPHEVEPHKPLKPESADVLEDFDRALKTPFGAVVRRDGAKVEGQQYNIRRIKMITGQGDREGYQVTMKVQQPLHKELGEKLRQMGGKSSAFEFYKGATFDKSTGQYVFKESSANRVGEALRADLPNATVFFNGRQGSYAMLGQLEARIWEPDGVKAAQAFRGLTKDLGIEDVLAEPSVEDERLLKLSRLAWQQCPQELAQLAGDPLHRDTFALEGVLKTAGIDPARADKMIPQEVYPGYKTYVEPGISKEYRKLGAKYLWAGVGSDVQNVANMLGVSDTNGMLSTLRRYQNGMIGKGISEGSDIETGGADNALVRLATKNTVGSEKYSDALGGSGYRICYDLKELERTDWYAYNGDQFGTARGSAFDNRKSSTDIISSIVRSWSSSNEFMFRRGVSLQNLFEVNADSDYERDALIAELKRKGIQEVNGIPVDKLVVTKMTH
jgi:hypothetical protein